MTLRIIYSIAFLCIAALFSASAQVPASQIDQIKHYLDNNENQQAYFDSQAITIDYPNEIEGHYYLACAAYRLDKLDEARDNFNLATEKTTNPRHLTQINQRLATVEQKIEFNLLLEKAKASERNGNIKSAAECYYKAWLIFPAKRTDIVLKSLELYLSSNDDNEAQFLMNELLKINDPNLQVPLSELKKRYQRSLEESDFFIEGKNEKINLDDMRQKPQRYLYKLIRTNNLKGVQRLIEYGADIDKINFRTGLTPIHESIESNTIDVLKLLLENGANPDIPNQQKITPLIYSLKSKAYKCALALLKHGANPNVNDNDRSSSLLLAIQQEQTNLAIHLLDFGANPEYSGPYSSKPLLLAIENKDTCLVSHLLAAGANPNIRNFDSEPALSLAIQKMEEDIAISLLYQGADINTKTASGKSLLLLSYEMKMWELLDLFILKKPDFQVKDSNGNTLLILAVQTKNYDLMKKLLSKGVNPNTPNTRNGYTPLHYCVEVDFLDGIDLLLQHEANKAIVNDEGVTPYKLSKKLNRKSIKTRLK